MHEKNIKYFLKADVLHTDISPEDQTVDNARKAGKQ
jgi:hypothetical protein